eukprot:TRINITY_DN5546_c0_g1_i1.p1 TRINITY_DN5546_c0_g1~~TRINITY_DN5546_c0_g1_i1.p1  ORF type:complete len:163 (+),score=32.24 TRINITY_DN5546_c0_g1_i1:22-489(+)
MIRRPPRSTHCISSAASDVYKRQVSDSCINPKPKVQNIKMKEAKESSKGNSSSDEEINSSKGNTSKNIRGNNLKVKNKAKNVNSRKKSLSDSRSDKSDSSRSRKGPVTRKLKPEDFKVPKHEKARKLTRNPSVPLRLRSNDQSRFAGKILLNASF